MDVEVRPARADEWRQYRALRLEMLADSPFAFGEARDVVAALPDDQWRLRARSRALPDSRWVVAVEHGRWIGQAMARRFGDRIVALEVYVCPAARGTGIADALLDDLERWTITQGYDALWLDVDERQQAARRLYARRGFVATGRARPNPNHPDGRELELRKPLPAQDRRT